MRPAYFHEWSELVRNFQGDRLICHTPEEGRWETQLPEGFLPNLLADALRTGAEGAKVMWDTSGVLPTEWLAPHMPDTLATPRRISLRRCRGNRLQLRIELPQVNPEVWGKHFLGWEFRGDGIPNAEFKGPLKVFEGVGLIDSSESTDSYAFLAEDFPWVNEGDVLESPRWGLCSVATIKEFEGIVQRLTLHSHEGMRIEVHPDNCDALELRFVSELDSNHCSTSK